MIETHGLRSEGSVDDPGVRNPRTAVRGFATADNAVTAVASLEKYMSEHSSGGREAEPAGAAAPDRGQGRKTGTRNIGNPR